ncbi:30S ribosomal protein S8 [Anaerolineales bacterium HSG6]|nr:30S ribosomal protein S8 [Anaerolineales bacterium HSG6]MDM8530074.1 30S ribosomal protein S8 [Anaerolineales bacterium HSG25]
MSVTDSIADMLTRVRNAGLAQHSQVAMPTSTMRQSIASILKDEGFIKDYEVLPGKISSTLLVRLKYTQERKPRSVIGGLQRVSKPGKRVYCRKNDIPHVRSGLGVCILSTSKGVITGNQAHRQNVGGEILCYVW